MIPPLDDATSPWLWLGFGALVASLLAVDLLWLNRRAHVLGFREAATWSGSLAAVALLFGLVILADRGSRPALEYYTGYVIELSLSVDNLFVFLMIFQYFAVPPEAQPRVLKWGVFGAMIMRGGMIAAGTLLLERFAFMIYVFGAVLVFTGLRMFRHGEVELTPERNPLVRWTRRAFPVSDRFDGSRFFTHGPRGLVATPLLIVVLVVEWSDVVFAVDSIPAIFAVTRDPFIVYTSNVFAVLGLRALFFLLAGMMHRFHYLKPGVALILVYVGIKMLLGHWVHVPPSVSLCVILATLGAAVLLSLWRSGPPGARPAPHDPASRREPVEGVGRREAQSPRPRAGRPRWVLYLALWVLMMALRQDFWLWDDDRLLFGVLPVGLAYQVGYSVLASAAMLWLVRRAWPVELERLEASGERRDGERR